MTHLILITGIILLTSSSCMTQEVFEKTETVPVTMHDSLTVPIQKEEDIYLETLYRQAPDPEFAIILAEPYTRIPEASIAWTQNLTMISKDTIMPDVSLIHVPKPREDKSTFKSLSAQDFKFTSNSKTSNPAKPEETSYVRDKPQNNSLISLPVNLQQSPQDSPVTQLSLQPSSENTVDIALGGSGWVFLESDTDIMFVSKNRDKFEEIFRFYAPEITRTRLDFQRQDLLNGVDEYRTIDLEILPIFEKEGGATDLIAAQPVEGENVFELKSDRSAVEMEVNMDMLAAEELEKLAHEAKFEGRFLKALEILQYIQSKHSTYQHNDRVNYTMARLLEEPSVRNINRSLSLYNEITEFYPLSPYEKVATERIRFIERNILKVF